MARSALTATGNDLISDSGAVLWSFVKGEQLEFDVTLTFLANVGGYEFEAVVIEADNVEGQADKPTQVKAGGVQTKLNVRVPTDRGVWQGIQSYNRDEVVFYNGLYYKLKAGVAYVNATAPSADANWEEYIPNVVFLQFPASLGSTWGVQPTVSSATYGFFELRVTEPASSSFRRTWKPVRGMVQLAFSPTDVVAD